jgi:hypothetical protein
MTLGNHARGSLARVLVPLWVALVAPAADLATPTPVEPPSAQGGETAPTPTPSLEGGRRRASRPQGRSGPEDRLRRLVKGLKLDAAQEESVRRALEAEQEALLRLASAPADPDVPRVAAIHAITTHTAERIRAVLNDEQKKLFGQPLPRDIPAQGKPDVRPWLDAMRAKGKD